MNRYDRYLSEKSGYMKVDSRTYRLSASPRTTCPACGSPWGVSCPECRGNRGARRRCKRCCGRGAFPCPTCSRAARAKAMCECGRFGNVESRYVLWKGFSWNAASVAVAAAHGYSIIQSQCLECWRRDEEAGIAQPITARLPDGAIVHVSMVGVHATVERVIACRVPREVGA